jgi:hypothetical protein
MATTLYGLVNALGDPSTIAAADVNKQSNVAELAYVVIAELLGRSGIVDSGDWNLSAGAGLSVDISAGRGVIGDAGSRMFARTTQSINLPSLTDASTCYVYKNRSSDNAFTDFTFNTTGTAPANTELVGTATTSGGAVTGVNSNPAGRRNLLQISSQNIQGGPLWVHRVDVPAGTTGNIDTVVSHKIRVVDVSLVKTTGAGGGAGTIQVLNGAAAISDAMSINVADQTVVRAATIDDANWEIAAGGTLRITRTRTASTNEACTVTVIGYRVA